MAEGPPRGSMASIAGDRLPWVEEVDAHVEIDLASARLARELRDSAREVIGLLPASPSAPTQALARQLAIAVSRLMRKTAVILDPEAVSVAKEAQDDASHELFALRRIDPLIVHCAPDHAAPPGAKAELLKLMLRHVDDKLTYGMIFVDMCGLVRPGELLAGLSMLDGVIVVGHRGRSTEPQIVAAARGVPPALALGVILAE